MNLLTIILELAFGGLFVATLITYLRRRDALSRDVMLIFASMAGLFLIAGVSAIAGQLPGPVIGAAFALLLAQPVFTLRLAARLRPMAAAVRIVPVVLWALVAVPMLVLPLTQVPLLVLAGIAVFVITDLIAAVYLGREAMRRVGSARLRLGAAAGGSLLMALALGVSTVASRLTGESGGDIGRVLALLAAILFGLAFLPPAWLRRIAGAMTAFQFTQHLLDGSFDERPETVWTRLADLARGTTGSVASMVLVGSPPVAVASSTIPEASRRTPIPTLRLSAIPTVTDDRRPLGEADGELAELARAFGAPYVSVLPFELAGGQPGALLLLRERPSLFAADDHSILTSLMARARVFAERSEALREEAALAQRLSATVTALEQASQAKSDFLASMSHELRTPLSAIIGFSALMKDEPLTGDTRAIPDEWIEHVRRSGDHLLSLINDVLDLTKIEAGRIDLDRTAVHLATALVESVEGLRPLASRKNIAMTVDAEPGTISADRGRLRQVIYNLISNAIKFTPEGGRVAVESRWFGNEARIAVIDSGVGIAPEDLDRVFQEFSQVGDMKAREAGTGLGLALSRRLVEAHGGHIVVASTPGEGSRFEVILPESRIEDPSDVAKPPPTIHGAGPSVLVIEDDPGAVRLLRQYLEGEGYQVEVATDGESGIAAARAHSPGAIILDVLLPGIDGWEVLRRLKSDASLRDIPVMVATVVDERSVAMNLGAVDYFLKPVRPEALLTRLATYTFTAKVKDRTVRVLVIDDDQIARELVVGALRPEGFEVVTAASGAEGLALAVASPPDLVICDLVMPEMDGFEVVNQLVANEATRDVPILILTGHDLSPEDRSRLNGKVADVMEKDGDTWHALRRWLRRASAAAARRSPPTAL